MYGNISRRDENILLSDYTGSKNLVLLVTSYPKFALQSHKKSIEIITGQPDYYLPFIPVLQPSVIRNQPASGRLKIINCYEESEFQKIKKVKWLNVSLEKRKGFGKEKV